MEPTAESETLCGVLEGNADHEGGVAWLADPAGARHEVWYPPGWRVEFDPSPILADPQGVTVARGGDVVCVEGLPLREATIGTVGAVFIASRVRS